MNTSKKLAQIKSRIEKNGYVEVREGIYLWDRDGIITESGCWDDEDRCKNFDFSSCNFWITTNAAIKPQGFDNLSEALVYILA